MEINLLVVENEESQLKLLRDASELFNIASDTKVVFDEAMNLKQGLQKLRTKQFDGAIVDLMLEQNDKTGEGNEILKEIKETLRFPVRVLTSHKGDLAPELQSENSLFKCRGRGEEEYETIFKEFIDIHSTGIIGILNNRGQIESHITNIFWKHISEILPEFITHKKANKDWDGEKVLLRYISSHILEYLEISIDNNLEPVFNLEFYIKPPVKEKIFTGDIIHLKGSKECGIILTPACDLATDSKRPTPKAEFVTLAMIDEFDFVTGGKNSGDIKKLKSNAMDLKYHFLPETTIFKGGFINFQRIYTIATNELNDKSRFEVQCVITNPFRKDIISRFANYFSRQGQPSFE